MLLSKNYTAFAKGEIFFISRVCKNDAKKLTESKGLQSPIF